MDEINQKEQQAIVQSVIATLTEREQAVIQMRFFQDMTRQQIAECFNVGIERIRQLEAKSLRKMRHPSRLNLLAECCCFA